jgi:hypothetical protein
MRLALALAAALGLAALSTATPVAEVHAQDNASFNDKFTITVARTGGDLNITVEGKTVDGGIWYVNTDYPMNLKLTAGAATLGKAELTKADATFEGTEKTGKAKKAKFKTTIAGADKVKVAYKLVVCSDTSCSPPIKGETAEK